MDRYKCTAPYVLMLPKELENTIYFFLFLVSPGQTAEQSLELLVKSIPFVETKQYFISNLIHE